MARVDNLENFLTDVAGAIKAKKGTTDKIPAADFDTEIKSITSGLDTSDATATVNDVISPKTFYSNGQKLTGLLIPTYLDLGRVKLERMLNPGQYIQDINLEYKFCLVCNHGTNNPVIRIYRLTDEYQLGDLVTSYTVQGSYKDFLFNAQISRVLDSNNKFVVWIASRSNGLNWTYNAFELDPNTLEISNAKYKDTYTSWGTHHNSNITINPLNPNEAFIAFPSGLKSDTRLMRATYDSAAGITESNLGQCYSDIDTYCEWDLSGNYILATNNFGGSAGYVLCSRTSRLKESNSTVPKCLVSGVYGFAGNTYFNFQTATVLYTYTDNTVLSQSGHIWCSDDRLYKYYNNRIYVYTMDLSTTYPTLTLLTTVNVSGYTGNSYMGTANAPVNGSEHAYVSSQVNAILWPPSTTQFLKTLRDVNNQMLYNTSDSSGVSSEVLQGRIVYGIDGKITGTMPNNGALNYTPTASSQSIPAGYTSGGTIAGLDSNSQILQAVSLTEDIINHE